eukprot:2257739-Amphidinium_carterae.1
MGLDMIHSRSSSHCISPDLYFVTASSTVVHHRSLFERSKTKQRIVTMWAAALALVIGYVLGRRPSKDDGFYWDSTTPNGLNGVATSGGMEVNGGGGRCSCVTVTVARMCVRASIRTCSGHLDLDRILAVGVRQR